MGARDWPSCTLSLLLLPLNLFVPLSVFPLPQQLHVFLREQAYRVRACVSAISMSFSPLGSFCELRSSTSGSELSLVLLFPPALNTDRTSCVCFIGCMPFICSVCVCFSAMCICSFCSHPCLCASHSLFLHPSLLLQLHPLPTVMPLQTGKTKSSISAGSV